MVPGLPLQQLVNFLCTARGINPDSYVVFDMSDNLLDLSIPLGKISERCVFLSRKGLLEQMLFAKLLAVLMVDIPSLGVRKLFPFNPEQMVGSIVDKICLLFDLDMKEYVVTDHKDRVIPLDLVMEMVPVTTLPKKFLDGDLSPIGEFDMTQDTALHQEKGDPVTLGGPIFQQHVIIIKSKKGNCSLCA